MLARASRSSVSQKDQLEIAVVSDLALYDPAAIMSLGPRIERLLTTDAAKAQPDSCFSLLVAGRLWPLLFAGDMQGAATAWLEICWFTSRACVESPDPVMREFCSVVHSTASTFVDVALHSSSFDWAAYDDGILRIGIEAYDYDKHHHKMMELLNMDYALWAMGISLPLALRSGDLETTADGFDRMIKAVPRMLAEPNQVPEAMTKLLLCVVKWPYLLGKGEAMVSAITDCVGGSWTTIDAWCDAFTDDADNNPYFAPRGQAGTGPYDSLYN